MGEVVQFPGAGKPVVSADSDVESLAPRDQWGRPLILQPDGSKIAYRRASSVIEAMEDHFGLDKWRTGLTLRGLAERPDLVAAIHGAPAKEVALIAEEAFLFAGGDAASRNGSTMHRLTDILDQGKPMPKGLPAHIQAMLECYARKTEHLESLDSERFTVQDKILVAGTYDRRVLDTSSGRVLIGDLKTGQNLKYLAIKAPAQVAVYASGVHYSLDGEREPHGAERDWGLLIHLPWTTNPAEAECEIRWLDLRIGRKAILEAIRVTDFRKLTMNQTMPRYHKG